MCLFEGPKSIVRFSFSGFGALTGPWCGDHSDFFFA